MKLAFHKGTGVLSRAIEYGTHSKYSHVELVFSDGMAFSARAERKPAVDIIPFDGSDGLWDFIEIPHYYDEMIVRPWAEKQRGKGYDWGADISFALPFVHTDAHKLMCASSCTTALQLAGLFTDFIPAEVSPGQLYVMAKVVWELLKYAPYSKK
jgi:hypothetical protein